MSYQEAVQKVDSAFDAEWANWLAEYPELATQSDEVKASFRKICQRWFFKGAAVGGACVAVLMESDNSAILPFKNEGVL